MTAAKVNLSSKELELVSNTDFILTKHSIIQKVYALMGETAAQWQRITQTHQSALPVEVLAISPKISKGENYQLLPYVMLDYPRYFTKEDSFAVRCFFWWGNFFSISLQLSGKYAQQYKAVLAKQYSALVAQHCFVCVADDPWEHHFERDNFCAVAAIEPAEWETLLNSQPFIKIACKISLAQWSEVPAFLETTFAEWMKILTENQAPSR